MRLTLFGRGQHRAADRIASLEAERDHALAELVKTDHVLSRLATQRVQDAARIEALAENVDALTTENESLRTDWDELYARFREVNAELENRRAITVPAPADFDLPPHLYDDEDTQELAVQRVIPLHAQAAAA